jgi:small subunit ribosomal protein S17
LYHKRIKYTKKYKAHDENNQAKIGDTVKIMETRPLSKDKRFRLIEVVEVAVVL